MQKIIQKLAVPKVILRYIMMNFTNINTIKNVILNVKIMNVLDNYSKDILAKAINGFIYNCKYDHLTVAKWLYSVGDVDIHVNNEEAFRKSCYYGYLTVAKWLYSIGNVDIHVNNEEAFMGSCYNDHLSVAKWLYSLGIDIDAKNKYVFKYSGKKVLHWLNTIKN